MSQALARVLWAFAAGVVLLGGAGQGCGGSSGAGRAGPCDKACAKLASCSPGASAKESCVESCLAESCTNEGERDAQRGACALETCDDFATCQAAVPTCQAASGVAGSMGSAGAQGSAGAAGGSSAGTSGSSGAAGTASVCTGVCARAQLCCRAIAPQNPELCLFGSDCAAATADSASQTAAACEQELAIGREVPIISDSCQ